MSSNNSNSISNGSSSTNRWDLPVLPHATAATNNNNNNNNNNILQTFQHAVNNNNNNSDDNYLPPFKRIRLGNDQVATIASGNLFNASPALLEIINKAETKSITTAEFIQQLVDNFDLANDGVLNALAQKGMYEEIKSLLSYKVEQKPLILNLDIYKRTLQIFYGLLSHTPQTALPKVRTLIEDILNIRCDVTADIYTSTIVFYQSAFFTETQQFLSHLADAKEFDLIEKVLSKRDQINNTAIIDWDRLKLALPLFFKMAEMGQFEIISKLLHAKGGGDLDEEEFGDLYSDIDHVDFVDNIFNETETDNALLLQDLFCRFAENGKYYLIKDLLFADIEYDCRMVKFETDKIIRLFKVLSDRSQTQDIKELLFNWFQLGGIYKSFPAVEEDLMRTIQAIARMVPVLEMLIQNDRIQVVYDTLLYANFERLLKYRNELELEDELESLEDFITLYTIAKQGQIVVNARLENFDLQSGELKLDMGRWNNAISQNNPQLIRDFLIEKSASGTPNICNFFNYTIASELEKMVDNGHFDLVFDVLAATSFFGNTLLHYIGSTNHFNEVMHKLGRANLQKTLNLFKQRDHEGIIPACSSCRYLIYLVDKQLLDVLDLMNILLIQDYTGKSMLWKLIDENLDNHNTESNYLEIYKQIIPVVSNSIEESQNRAFKLQLINMLKGLVSGPN